MSIRNARFLVGVFILCLGACANPPQTRLVLGSPPVSLPRHAELSEVPFFAQEAFQCGPASLSMSLNAAGIAVTPETLKPELYLPDRHGSLQVEMLAATRRHGATAYQLAPELNDMLREIAAGTPVVVLQNLAFGWYPVWHYAVAIGYDLDHAEIILRSGPEQRQILPMKTFEYTWARSGYWAMVALPPGKIPETAEETDPKSTRLNSSHLGISYAVFCLKKKKKPVTDRDTATWRARKKTTPSGNHGDRPDQKTRRPRQRPQLPRAWIISPRLFFF